MNWRDKLKEIIRRKPEPGPEPEPEPGPAATVDGSLPEGVIFYTFRDSAKEEQELLLMLEDLHASKSRKSHL